MNWNGLGRKAGLRSLNNRNWDWLRRRERTRGPGRIRERGGTGLGRRIEKEDVM